MRLSDKNISQLFTRLHSIFAHLWTSQWQTENALFAARYEWAVALHAFSGQVLSMALRRIVAGAKKHPPTLSEFVAICKACNGGSGAAYREPVKALPKLKATKEQVSAHLAKCKSFC